MRSADGTVEGRELLAGLAVEYALRPREARWGATLGVRGDVLDAQIKVLFVTHRFDFADRFYRQNARSTLFLRAERGPDGRRNYKLAVKEPLPTSFGEDLYYQLGAWLDEDRAVTPAAAGTSPDGEADPASGLGPPPFSVSGGAA